jgi:hypothetical protein
MCECLSPALLQAINAAAPAPVDRSEAGWSALLPTMHPDEVLVLLERDRKAWFEKNPL